MECAFDLGVTHFDVARSYGYGEAESVLGQFAAGRRKQITIATKFGILPARMSKPLRVVKPLIRKVIHHVPGMRKLVRRASAHALKHGFYTVEDARLSVDRSLQQLRTDYLDCLFIHDCSPSDPLTAELFDFLKELVASGKIRAWGYATRREWVSDLCRRNSVAPMIVQFEQSLFDITPVGAGLETVPVIHHSPFGRPEAGWQLAEAVARMAQSDTPDIKRLATRLATPATRSRFLLESALQLSSDSPVLCSMFDVKHIRANVSAVDAPNFIPEHIEHVRQLVRQTSL
jgi:aryl-alcohol dehydrogenase-like predicted oxidoreductase